MTTAAARAQVLLEWFAEGRKIVLGQLVGADGSAPLDPGAMMMIDEHGRVEGTITGGCVEAAVIAEAEELLTVEATSPNLVSYGYSDGVAASVGLTCGGTVHVLVQALDDEAMNVERIAARAVLDGEPNVVATVVDGPVSGAKLTIAGDRAYGSLGAGTAMDNAVIRDGQGLLGAGRSGMRSYGTEGSTLGSEIRVFFRVMSKRPQMIIVGALDFSAALAPMAAELGFAVSIVDARESFISSARFRRAAEVIKRWPDDFIAAQSLSSRDVVIVMTHDPKFDEPALKAAVATEAGYIGALGSRRTVAERSRRLHLAGMSDSEIRRIHAPCGLDLGARGPDDTADSIRAEILAERSQRRGGPLNSSELPIHDSTLQRA